ncbi:MULTISPECIES: sigma-70 family RNA polymerase sigma factor [Bacillus]|uniref:sigma-70 family RNA polymerase sigma factor n=1 Tax=Bacillus TaxID=1386 RepID=UPI0002E8D805|nr:MULTISPECIES: sigma-70 family RNA polymerase sigma factor [Bacillus]
MEEEQLTIRAINGDDIAFLQLMNLHKLPLYKTALAYLKNEEEALEAIQEVTCRAYVNISKVREASFVKTWLIRIMINYCNDRLRSKSKIVQQEELLHVQVFKDSYEQLEILDAMNSLDERAKEIIILKYFHDLKIKDIAAVLNRPEGTIKSWLNRALASLRQQLEDKEVETNARERRKPTEPGERSLR